MKDRRAAAGFTLIELLIVVAIIGILASMAVVQLRSTKQKAMEAALKENLYVLRNCIDQYFTDKGKYPENLEALVDDGYIRKIPVDPFTESDTTWVEEQAASMSTGAQGQTDDDPSAQSGIADVHSGATGTALDGTSYSEW
ncbi:MAG TPA: prepilin-type N-terminal cleavage/methylation domain-containing protein [Candidatus Polarisedimenticolia bacterium]|nr:prepilin-type N-terminal cleavage/methylation domain-containing protein [Candidatus Polarisedimenticolia bacterium]